MIDEDPPVQPDPVARAIAHFRLSVSDAVAPAESYSSTVRLLTLKSGERVVLKIPYTPVKFMREVTALQHLTDLPVPRIIDARAPAGDSTGALLISYLPGDPMQVPAPLDLERALGRLLAGLHLHRLPAFGEVHESLVAGGLGWWVTMGKRFDLWVKTCQGVVADDLLVRMRQAHDELSADLPEADGPCWVHADFRPGNVLVAEGRITGLIDFESARGGSADLDFVKVSHALFDAQPESRAAFLTGYDEVRPHPDIDRSLPYYRLHNAVGGLAWCIRRTDVQDPFYRDNYEVVQQILERQAVE